MKLAAAIILSCCFVIQNISKTVIVLNFESNREYIAENLCENRDEPDSCCEGSCHLKKQLEQDDRANQSTDAQGKQKFEKSEYCDTGIRSKFALTMINIHFCDNLSSLLVEGFTAKDFRPPRA